MKKKNENEYVYFFWVFPVPGTNNNIDEKKKTFWCSNVGWATAQIILWELYCKAVIVLQ